MRKNIYTGFAAFSFLLLVSCGQSPKATVEEEAGAYKKESVENAILEEEVAASLKYLSSDELQGRATGTDGIELAARYIEEVFKTHGVKPFFETYRDSFEVKGVTGYNLGRNG